ncbi:sensor histidine kinase [Paenibacillus nanensis]|uniref:histidine kinase n=1 Tax=Paenibacillus nanensis TaxID=393251 RepID=A0A3A1UI91_9BACL|nr:HAMP domain-containing sensor histidine kinase [Paenibacillus nanensis]RIX46556.1 sensor histidine kinase [Paenibacillus nanensis]
MRIRQWPLSVKLWSVFAALTLFIFALLAVLLPWLLKSFFTDQLYDILIDSQTNVMLEYKETGGTSVSDPVLRVHTSSKQSAPGLEAPLDNPVTDGASGEAGEKADVEPFQMSGSNQDVRSVLVSPDHSVIRVQRGAEVKVEQKEPMVQHFIIHSESAQVQEEAGEETSVGTDPFVTAIEKDALAQQQPIKKYKADINDQSLFYVIRKEMVEGDINYIVSYAWGNYRNDLVMTMFKRLMLLMVGLIVISWLPCMVLARYLTRPLVQMERHVGRLADRDWHEPLKTGRHDEIGRLAQAIESMRQRLVRQDKAQQFFLQNTSHELKTPVMVIRSYVQSIRDGIYPKGTLHGSLNIIMQEAERLERKIRDLLILNKLNYLSARDIEAQRFIVKPIVEDAIQRLRYRRPEISWQLDLDDSASLVGDREQWNVALENLLDNQLRYARSVIQVTVEKGARQTASKNEEPQASCGNLSVIRIANDGPQLDEEAASRMFERYQTGASGQFGLGLTIVRQIAENHGLSVRAANEADGVAFYLEPWADQASELAG